MVQEKIPVGISACLLGQKVRFDGGHKQSRFCLDHLARVFEFSSYCPEMAIGLGAPRESIRLVGDIAAPRVVGTKSPDLDVTDSLYEYGREIGRASQDLCGYILMKNSPSCGLYSAKIYRNGHNLPGRHAGMFVRGLQIENPLLPLEEEGRLNDAHLRENFIARVYAYYDWKRSVEVAPSAKKLVDFHSRYKYLLMAHSQAAYRLLGQWVSKAGSEAIVELCERYLPEFMAALTVVASRRSHANTLYHLLGYLREDVPGNIRQELAKEIESYRKGAVNLSVPVALLKHYLKLHGSDYVNSQAYLQPHSYDLGLRNAV